MNGSDPRTLRDDLDLLAAEAPVRSSAPSDLLERVASRRRRTVALLSSFGGVLAVGAVVALTVLIPSLSATSDPDAAVRSQLGTPTSTTDSVAVDYEAACTPQDRRAGVCPIDEVGRQKWEEIFAAFERHLTPIRLVGSKDPDGLMTYSFEATIGATPVSHTPYPGADPDPARLPTLWVQVGVPAIPTTSSPTASTHPGTPPDFRYGEGIVTIVQADGTQMMLRFWDAKPTDAAMEEGELDVVALFTRAIAQLSAR